MGGDRGMTAREIHAELLNRGNEEHPDKISLRLNYGVRLGRFRRSGEKRFHIAGRLKT